MPEQRDTPGADDELYERLAAIEHERWASWQRYLHSKCTVQIATDRDPGALVIPSGYVANLWRLIDHPVRRPHRGGEGQRPRAGRPVLASRRPA